MESEENEHSTVMMLMMMWKQLVTTFSRQQIAQFQTKFFSCVLVIFRGIITKSNMILGKETDFIKLLNKLIHLHRGLGSENLEIK